MVCSDDKVPELEVSFFVVSTSPLTHVAGCDSILTDADTMLGNEATKGLGETIAGDLKGTGNARRQLNGIGKVITFGHATLVLTWQPMVSPL